MRAKDPNKLLEQIAKKHLFIETLETQHSDRLDFHDVSVWGVKSALQAAYEAGRKAANTRQARISTQS
jgi:hypothetical protein